jgi:radical SAM protein with 4Fe4S-binding SPASM domain
MNVINKDFPVPRRYLCIAPWADLYIDSDGNVYPCCGDSFVTMNLGNAAERTLEEIWLGEPYMRLREEMLGADFSEFKQCGKCPVWNLSLKRHYINLNNTTFLRSEYYGVYKYEYKRRFPGEKYLLEKYLKETERSKRISEEIYGLT